MSNWDDLRIVLALADAGSVTAAAQHLGVAHTTVLRRLAAFEKETGARIFDKTSKGYVINHDNLAMLESLREAGRSVEAAHRKIAALAMPSGGSPLRVTSTDAMCVSVMPRVLTRIARPGRQVSLMSANAHVNLAHGHADVAVRVAPALPSELKGSQVGYLGFALYAGPGDAENVIGVSGPLTRSPPALWIRESGLRVDGYADSFVVMREMVAAGLGRALLPCVLANADSRLTRIGAPRPEFTVPVWVAAHRDLGDAQRIRQLQRDLAAALKKLAPELLGVAPE